MAVGLTTHGLLLNDELIPLHPHSSKISTVLQSIQQLNHSHVGMLFTYLSVSNAVLCLQVVSAARISRGQAQAIGSNAIAEDSYTLSVSYSPSSLGLPRLTCITGNSLGHFGYQSWFE